MRIKVFKRKKKKKKQQQQQQLQKQMSEANDPTEATSLLLISPTLDEPKSEIEENLSKARDLLYRSHFAARFTEVGWQFCLIIFLTALTGYKSFTLVSTYGLFTGLVLCLAGPSIGRYVDSTQYARIEIAQVFIWVQNLSVFVATVCCFMLLRMVKEGDIAAANHISNFIPPFNVTSFGLLVGIHVFGAIAKLTDAGMTVAMERDWIVVMSKLAAVDFDDDDEYHARVDGESCNSDSSSYYSVGSISVGKGTDLDKGIIRKLKEKMWLSQTNTTMKQIDLLCKVAGPAAAGIYLSAFDNNDPSNSFAENIRHWHHLSYAALIIGLLNLLSLYVEFVCTNKIYKLVPLLSVRRIQSDKQGSEVDVEIIPQKPVGCGLFDNFKIGMPQSLSLYFQQPIAPGGLALAMLYLNVLTFGGLMTAYLVWLGVSYNTIGTLRGISSVIGLLGTMAFAISVRTSGLAFTGLWSIIFQFGWLGLCYLSIYIKTLYLALWLLVIGVCCSRIGLWAFDLTITQYMQQEIPENIRGVIGGVQKSLNGFFDLTTFALGLIFSDPKDFHILVSFGYCSVGCAMVLYFFGVYRKRDELH